MRIEEYVKLTTSWATNDKTDFFEPECHWFPCNICKHRDSLNGFCRHCRHWIK
jgi:hypothetical protein